MWLLPPYTPFDVKMVLDFCVYYTSFGTHAVWYGYILVISLASIPDKCLFFKLLSDHCYLIPSVLWYTTATTARGSKS